MELYRWLRDQGISVDFADFTAGDILGSLARATVVDAGVIALGSSRVNGILEGYQKLPLRLRGESWHHLPFRLRLYDVAEFDEGDEHIGTYEEEHGSIESSIPVVITRRRGVKRNSATLIASNHGRAVQRPRRFSRTKTSYRNCSRTSGCNRGCRICQLTFRSCFV